MPSYRRSRGKKFLEGYVEADSYLARADIKLGRPALYRAQAPDGREVLVKFWPDTTQASTDLEDIWRSEIRQLQRLAAVPRADDLFVPVFASGEDAEGFYLVLDPGQGSPLELFRKSKNPPNALVQSRLPRNRHLIWSNALRLAQALELLHSQGIIHRNIDPWSIITSFGDQPDFRLTGFEWSMRIASMDENAGGVPKGDAKNAASFGNDWRNLGFLLAELIGAPNERIANLRHLPSEIADHVTSSEGKVLRTMLGVDGSERLDGLSICGRIEEVLNSLEAKATGKELKSALALKLGTGSSVSDAIRRASNYEIEMADTAAQIQFVRNDLSSEAFIARLADKGVMEARPVLIGRFLTYNLTPFRIPHSAESADWEFATCERAQFGRPPPTALRGHELIALETLDILSSTEANQSFPRRRGRVARWDTRIAALAPKELQKNDWDRKHQAFALLSILELAYAAADVFPIEVRTDASDRAGDLHILSVMSRHDAKRARLSKVLQLDPPAIRLTKKLERGDDREDGAWWLSESGLLGDRERDTEWRFVSAADDQSRAVLKFEGMAVASIRGQGYLSTSGIIGQVAQFRRRVKALTALANHTELLKMLVDPRGRIEPSHDPVVEDNQFKSLDESKRKALEEILSTIPLFLLQGPPGVGKTFLVGEIVRRRFDDESTTRMLLSAQSNAAIDHLMMEVKSVFDDDDQLVMVRARPAEDDPADTDLEIDRQADKLLQALSKSELVKNASDEVREKIVDLAESRAAVTGKKKSGKRIMTAESRAFESMILRAANLVFATTNSAAIEQLIEERGLFDWTIVEEAGKATGGELLSPLLLSHRRLMIGDHKQLPPFGADKMAKLLANPESVREAVRATEDLVSLHLRDAGMEEIFDEVELDDVDYGRLCADTLEILTLFESMVERELARGAAKGGDAIARRLNEQRRMHPAIAQVVSDCFYDRALLTNKIKEQEYRTNKPPVISSDVTRLPESPIVLIEMPYVRTEVNYKGGDRPPPWSNPDEVMATLDVLKLLRARDGQRPSLAVLSPYYEQVKLLRPRIEAGLHSALKNLKAFKPAVGSELYCGTVDSFQGNQADIVVVSLVRNNEHVTPGKALGFLRDVRRMNVLLSRAKWRIVIIGSFDFLRHVLEFARRLPDSDVGFLERFLKSIDAAKDHGDAKCVAWSDLSRGH